MNIVDIIDNIGSNTDIVKCRDRKDYISGCDLRSLVSERVNRVCSGRFYGLKGDSKQGECQG